MFLLSKTISTPGIQKRSISGASYIYNTLLKKKIDNVGIYTGGSIMSLVNCFYQGDIKYYINTHEQSLGHMLTGYAKSSNYCGVGVVTSGPGLTNMVTPLLDATNDSTPLIVFSGQVAKQHMGTNAFQECSAVDITKPVTKWSYCVETAKDLPIVLEKAFQIATQGKPGSVHIDLPKDVLTQDVMSSNMVSSQRGMVRTHHDKTLLQGDKIQEDVSIKKTQYVDYHFIQAAEVINKSLKPIFYLGKGCNNYSKEITQLINRVNIPVTTTIHAMGVYDEDYPLSLNMLGMHGHVAANNAIQEADCIIALGSRFDDRTTGNLEYYAPIARKKKSIIHVNIEASEICKVIQSNFNFEMDIGDFLDKVSSKINQINRTPWQNKIITMKHKFPFVYNKLDNNRIKTQDVICSINKYVNENKLYPKTYYTSGVGNHQMMAAQFIDWKCPKRFITSGSLGVMGVGLPYAIGTQIAHPDALVIDIDGDASFNHTLSELKTVVEYNLPIKIAIMNDKAMSMVKVWEDLFFDKRYTATSCPNNPDYAKLANSYGIHSISCSSRLELENKIRYFIEYPGPIVADFRVESDYCFPLVAPGKALDDMILHPIHRENKTPIELDSSIPPS